MFFDKLFGNEESDKEPGYIRTMPHDGRKYIDPDEFIKLPHVQEQMNQLEDLLKSYQSSSAQEEAAEADNNGPRLAQNGKNTPPLRERGAPTEAVRHSTERTEDR